MHANWRRLGLVSAAICTLAGAAAAQQGPHQTKVNLNLLDTSEGGPSVGSVSFTDSQQGLALEIDLKGLPPGEHGMHVHEHPNCGAQSKDGKMVPGLAAGDHFDPQHTGAHHGPDRADGHLGDLPKVVVDKDGTSKQKLLAPRLKVADLRGRSLVIHAGGDNYADQPKPVGGGGDRLACGIFEIKVAR